MRWFMLLALILPSAALAAVVYELEVPDLAIMADRVIVGEVLSVESQWNRTATGVVSTIRLRVEESLKGEGPDEVVIRQAGGQVRGGHTAVTGVPVFMAGERYLLFLERLSPLDQPALYRVVGLGQGRFQLRQDPEGEDQAEQDLQGLILAKPTGRGALGMSRVGRRFHRLGELLEEVHRALPAREVAP